MNREKKAITVALYGLLIALAMVLSFVETAGTGEPCNGGGALFNWNPRNHRRDPDPHRSCGTVIWKSLQHDLRAVWKLFKLACDGGIEGDRKALPGQHQRSWRYCPQYRPDHLCGSYRPDTRGILLSAISSGSRMHRGNTDRNRRRNHYGAASACDAGDKKIK